MAYTPTEWVSGTIISASKLNNIERGVESVNSEYTPTTWAEGDTVTAAKLNKIEQGIADASGGDIITVLTSVPSGSANVTMQDEGNGRGTGYASWFIPDYPETQFGYVDSLTLTIGNETLTIENNDLSFAFFEFADCDVQTLFDNNSGSWIFEIFSSTIVTGTISLSWSATNIYTASSETEAYFPNLFVLYT